MSSGQEGPRHQCVRRSRHQCVRRSPISSHNRILTLPLYIAIPSIDRSNLPGYTTSCLDAITAAAATHILSPGQRDRQVGPDGKQFFAPLDVTHTNVPSRLAGLQRYYQTARLLSPTRTGSDLHPSKLQPPQYYHATMQVHAGANGVAEAGPAGDGQSMVDDDADRDGSRDETIEKLSKVVRSKNRKIQEVSEELDRYKALFSELREEMNSISKKSTTTDQDVANLADDLASERRSHKAAIESLDRKTREVEQHSQRLADLEDASAAIHRENLELSGRIQEMNRLANEKQEQLQEALALAAQAKAEAEAAAAAKIPEGVVIGEEGATGAGGGELQKELDQLKQALELKTKQLETTRERASKTSMELQYYRGQARSGRFMRLLLKLWWLLRAVGFLGFFLFAYLAVSEDAFRSRGVDVYRLAH